MPINDPEYCVRAEYAFMLNVLETAEQMGGPPENRLALLQAARDQILKRGLPDELRARAAVTLERETALGIIDQELNVSGSVNPLGGAHTRVSQKARDWMERNP